MVEIEAEHALAADGEAGPDVFAIFYSAAQERAADHVSPMPWNGARGWQEMGNALARLECPTIKEECIRKGLVWERYLASTWKEVMEDLHGPDWRKELRASSAAGRKAIQTAAEAPSLLCERGTVTRPTAAPR